MRTALDFPTSALDAGEGDFLAKVREHGWFATHVLGEGDQPGFSYSTGFWLSIGAPEVIVFSLKREIAHNVLWDIFRDVQGGLKLPVGKSTPNIFGNAAAYLFPVAPPNYPEHLGWSRWFYCGDEFPCVQLVWPDPSGVFPWQSHFDGRFRTDQPDLSETGWVSVLAQ